MLGQPYGVEAAAVHDFDALERAGEHIFQRTMATGPAEELENADFHCFPSAFAQ